MSRLFFSPACQPDIFRSECVPASSHLVKLLYTLEKKKRVKELSLYVHTYVQCLHEVSRRRIHPRDTFRSRQADVRHVMLLTPFDDSLEISALVDDVEIGPLRVFSGDPSSCDDPDVGIADEFLTQDFDAMVWKMIPPLAFGLSWLHMGYRVREGGRGVAGQIVTNQHECGAVRAGRSRTHLGWSSIPRMWTSLLDSIWGFDQPIAAEVLFWGFRFLLPSSVADDRPPTQRQTLLPAHRLTSRCFRLWVCLSFGTRIRRYWMIRLWAPSIND